MFGNMGQANQGQTEKSKKYKCWLWLWLAVAATVAIVTAVLTGKPTSPKIPNKI
jgi:hypothetical protein